jgi:CBS domain-containing protein
MNLSDPISIIFKQEMVIAHPDSLVKNVKNIFNKKTFHHLLVVNDSGELEGTISHLDLYNMVIFFKNRPSTSPPMKVKDFMTKHSYFLSPRR